MSFVLRFIFKIIFKMKYFHRNYVFLLIASALTTVPVSYTHLIVFGEDRLRGRCSLPATFYVLTTVKYLKIHLNFFKQW